MYFIIIWLKTDIMEVFYRCRIIDTFLASFHTQTHILTECLLILVIPGTKLIKLLNGITINVT